MRSSTEGTRTGAQHMPAWKRLGLKLKQPTASEPANGGTPAIGHPAGAQQSVKRKFDAPLAAESSLDNKRSRREGLNKDRNAPLTKSVSFGDTPTKNGKAPGDSKKPLQDKSRQQRKPKGPEKKKKPVAPTDLKPALEYLRLWKTSRDSWKFNKNHQSALIKHLFDADGIPSADIETLYNYIRDLKGFVRTRLRETAMEIRTKDVSDRSSAFPAGTLDLDAKQISYERLLTDLLHTRSPSRKRKSFDEADFVATSQDVDVIIRRVVKRMRAELVLEELADGEQTDDSTQSSRTVATSDTKPGLTPSSDKRVRLNDGTPKRRRKLRVNVDDSSSSESDSESGSDTSSDSSSDESEDEDEADAQSAEGYESSSSESSSSSSSAGESDSDSDDSSDSDEEN